MKLIRFTDSHHAALLRDLDFEDSVVVHRLKAVVLQCVLLYYETHTARETCEKFGIPFTPEYVKILHRLRPKAMGGGGARKGAGKRKNHKFSSQ